MTNYDIIIIGSGPGGYETAARAAAMGMRTLIVERSHPGGTCLNRGCIPTKALSHSAELLLSLSGAKECGITFAETPSFDFSKAMERKDSVVSDLREGVMTILNATTFKQGEARFIAPDVIAVGDEEFTAPKIVVATGSAPARLNIAGAELAATSDDLLQWDTLPASLAIIGGGVIGMEFASIMAAFGVKVSVIEYCPEILPPFDAEVAKRLRMTLKRRGINIVTSATVTAIEPGCVVRYTSKGKEQTLEAERVLMAVGRKPVLPDGLTDVGVATDRRGFVTVDCQMHTSVEGIYAIGDVNGICMLAHAATAQGAVMLGINQKLDPVPSVVFTHPECAAVGLTEKQCEEEGINYAVGHTTFRANGKAMTMGQPDGMVKILVDRDTHQLLGCHICGAHASDLITEATLAIASSITADQVVATIHAHPTLSEAITAALSNVKY